MMNMFSKIAIIFLMHLVIYPSSSGRLKKKMNFIQFMYIILDAFRNNAEACCEIGRIQAKSTKTCTMPLQLLTTENSKQISPHCRFLTHICCLANLRDYFCEEGLKTALRLLPCNETQLESKDSYQVL